MQLQAGKLAVNCFQSRINRVNSLRLCLLKLDLIFFKPFLHSIQNIFVGQPKIRRKMEAEDAQSFTDVCQNNGIKHTVRVTNIQHIPATHNNIRILGLAPGAMMLYIQRVHSADGDPIMVENNYYPLERFAFLENEDLESGSLFHLLSDKYGINPFGTSSTRIEVVRASVKNADLLNVKLGEPLLYVDACFKDRDNANLFLGKQYIIGNRYVMVL